MSVGVCVCVWGGCMCVWGGGEGCVCVRVCVLVGGCVGGGGGMCGCVRVCVF